MFNAWMSVSVNSVLFCLTWNIGDAEKYKMLEKKESES